MFDWMHTYFVNGIFNWEFNQLMADLAPYGKGHETFHAYLQAFEWPKGYASGRNLCAKAATSSSAKEAHASASDFLSVVPVVDHYVQNVCRGCGIDELILDCMTALCKVVQIILQADAGAQVQTELDAAIDEHLRRHIACRGYTMWKPKFHYSLHIKMVKGYLLSRSQLGRMARPTDRPTAI